MRHRTLLAVSGLVVAVCLLALAGFFPIPVEAQNPSTSPPPVQEPPVPPPARPPDAPASQPAPAGMSIDQLMEQLTRLRAQRAELEKLEKEVMDALKEKLKEQRQRLQKLGVPVEEQPVAPTKPVPPPIDKLRIAPPPGPGK